MLFGHQNDDNQPNDGQNQAAGTNPLAVDPATGVSLPVMPEELEHDGSNSAAHEEPALDQPASPAPVASTNDAAATDSGTVPSVSSASSDDVLTPSSDDELLTLKQQALQQLSPLVGHLDQTPEEKFRTTMMMIQSSDNQSLIKDAYAAAQQISDDKARAQALLDIVNEINYFTHQAQDEE
jgi:hypothetical protein